MQLVISPTGIVQCVYDEAINLAALGPLEIQRASQVEPNADGAWQADLSKMLGPILGPFELRSQALLAEREWLETHWLGWSRLDAEDSQVEPSPEKCPCRPQCNRIDLSARCGE